MRRSCGLSPLAHCPRLPTNLPGQPGAAVPGAIALKGCALFSHVQVIVKFPALRPWSQGWCSQTVGKRSFSNRKLFDRMAKSQIVVYLLFTFPVSFQLWRETHSWASVWSSSAEACASRCCWSSWWSENVPPTGRFKLSRIILDLEEYPSQIAAPTLSEHGKPEISRRRDAPDAYTQAGQSMIGADMGPPIDPKARRRSGLSYRWCGPHERSYDRSAID